MRGKGAAFESPCPAQCWRDRVDETTSSGFLAAFLTHGFAAEFDAKSVVDQPVENAVCNGGIADRSCQ